MSSLMHHGIKGQRWGVRRYQNKDGTRTAAGKKREADRGFVIKKGSIVKRTTDNKIDYKTGRRKYVSINDEDAKKWRDFFAEDTWTEHYEHEYKAKKDLYIATGKDVVEIISNEFKSDADKAKLARDTMTVNLLVSDELFRKAPKGIDQAAYDASSLMRTYSSQYDTESGKRIAEAIMKSGFDGLIDSFGQDISEAPVIIFDAEKKLKKKGVKNINAIHTSIGGTMYIEGNALILGDSSYLEHHGILGQKWGVRRFQNKDGTRTAAGKKREAENATSAKAQIKKYRNRRGKTPEERLDILQGVLQDATTWSEGNKSQRKELYEAADVGLRALQKLRPGVLTDEDYSPENIDRNKEWFLIEDQTTGMGMISHLIDQKGYSAKDCKDLIKIVDKNYDPDEWNEWTDQRAEDLIFELREGNYKGTLEKFADLCEKESAKKKRDQQELKELEELEKEEQRRIEEFGYDPYDPYDTRRLNVTHSALFIEDGTLYLSHHGIRGQRWGVRRFQNRDGSLTNAGRKRLGYATKGAAQTVGKAFKAGVKAGGNAVKAVKAHHEKKEAEKLQKKKEKASKTRLGVMANKDLFTNEEIRKLNERFKLEDEMKMATLQKGVEIAKAVGTIAQNVGYVAKTYEDVTGQSLSPIKRKAAEEKARQDKEDRERRIAREDADEARKAAKEERDIAIHEQTLRKAIASADTQEFTAQKTKAEADSSILDLYKKGQDFNGGSDATGQSWVEKAKNGGKNPFDDMIADRDPEYAQIRKEHEEKVARKERIAELERREKEREAEKAAASRPQQSQKKQSNDDALFSQKGSLPIDKDRYRNNRAMEKAKQVKEDAAEERAKKQDEKAAKATIDDMMEARRKFTDSARANSNGAFDRETAANYIKGKAKELPSKLNPINAIAKKITNKALKEEEDNARKTLEDEYKKTSRSQGRDEANYTMYYNRVNALQAQGYSERQAKKVADTENPFSSKRNRRFEYNEKVGEIETAHRKNAKEINKANKELTDYYYKLINGPGYDPGTPKREALDRKYAQKRGELEKLEKDNNDMLDREKKKAKKILEHSFSIQNGVLFVDSSDSLAHHGVKGQRWGVRRFQNEDGSLTEKGRKHYEKVLAKEKRKQVSSDAIRGTLERQHPFAVTGAAIMGAVAAGMSIAATGGASVAMIAAGSAISAAVSAGLTHVSYSASEAWEGRGTRMRSKKIDKYENILKQSDGENGMYHVENGTLFIDAGDPYLEHHGVLGMKWGKHLRAGKGPADAPASAGGGGGEDDEKLKEMAKKAGMSVAEYKQKFASKIGGAASKVGSAVYDAAGGSHKKNAEGWRKMAREESNAARASEKSSHENSARAASQDRKYGSGGDAYRRAAESDKENAETHRSNAKARSERAASEQAAYEKSLAGKYDKMKADRARKKSASKIGGAASKVGEKVYDAAGGKYKQDYNHYRKKANDALSEQLKYEHKRDVAKAEAASEWRKAKKADSEERYGDSQNHVNKRNEKQVAAKGYNRRATEAHNERNVATEMQNKAQSKYEKSLAGKYDRLKAKRNKKSVKKKASRLRKARHLLPKLKHFDDTNAIYTEGTRLVVNSKWG